MKMNADKLSILQEMLEECLEEQSKEKKILQDNLNRISEIDTFFDMTKENIEYDLKVFSPRSVKTFDSDIIKQREEEKKSLELENQEHYQKINKLDKQIEQLKIFIKNSDNKYFMVLDIQEKERQRIARELHDSSIQNLTHLVHKIELSSMYMDEDIIRAKLELESCIKNLRATIEEIRETIFNLRPMSFDDLGFKQCMQDFVANIKMIYKNCEIEFDVCDLDQYNWVTKDKEAITLFLVTIYRVVQEAVTNALKHSQANQLFFSIKVDKKKCLINIKDNGKGFSVNGVFEQKDKHFGIPVMKERINLLNGSIDFNSEIGTGTELNITIPLI